MEEEDQFDFEENDVELNDMDIDIETMMKHIASHDPKFDLNDKSKVYREAVSFLKPAMSEKEERDYDALNIEIYLIVSERYIYMVDIDSLEWIFDHIPI
jgi:hypothetical protein